VSTYKIHYTVDAGESGTVRIPLAVPQIPTSGAAGSVKITVDPAAGEVIAGDMFPALHRDFSGSFAAELANVPNHVQLEIRRGQGFRERWLTPLMLSDLAVIALVAFGSVARALIRRKAEV
jgi:hypothetical protein